MSEKTAPSIQIKSLVGKLPRRIDWLWRSMIPVGELTILYGRGGVGKSTIARSIAAILSNGKSWPASDEEPRMTSTLILEDEDSEDRTLAVLQAHEANLERTLIMGMVDDGRCKRPFSIATDIAILEKALQKHPEFGLIVLSPINSFIGIEDDKNVLQLRRALTGLNDLAHRTGTAFLGIAHPRKQTEGNVQDSLAGSHVWVAAARSVIMAIEDPDSPDERRFLGTIKNNYSKSLITLSYTIQESIVLGVDGQQVEAPRIEWGTEVVAERMDSIFSRAREGTASTDSPEAAMWLEGVLSDGPKAVKEIYSAGREAGFKDSSTLRKAKGKIGARHYREGSGLGSRIFWTLEPSLTAKALASVNDGLSSIHTSSYSSESWEEI